jgi:glutamine synthetase
VPSTLRDALGLWQSGALARAAFGDEVVAHYANAASVELAAYDAAVTDWELFRGFERL